MGKYYAIYKCLMCNKEMRSSDQPIDMEENMIPSLLGKVVVNQQFLGSLLYDAPLYIPHKCYNGDGGLAQLIGFRKVQ